MSQSGMAKGFSGGVLPANVATEYVTDAGSAVPSANILNVLGGAGISTSGAGNTVTVTTSQNPTNILTLVDDFIQHSTGFGQLDWRRPGNAVGDQISGTAAHPGLINIFNSSDTGIYLASSSLNFPFVLGGGEITLNMVVDLIALGSVTNDYTVRFGLGNWQTTTISDGVFISYNYAENGGNWVGNGMTASVTSSSNSNIPATTGFVNLGIIINAAATSVTFYVNGVQFANPVTTNIPSADIGPFIWWHRNAGAIPEAQIDLFYMKNTLTTTR